MSIVCRRRPCAAPDTSKGHRYDAVDPERIATPAGLGGMRTKGTVACMSQHPSHRLEHHPPVPQDKPSWRRAIRAERRRLSPELRAEEAALLRQRVLEVLDAAPEGHSKKVAAYFSSPDEPDTAPLLQELTGRGFEVYLPVCEPGDVLSWTRWEPGTEIVQSRVAPVNEPVGPRHDASLFAEIDLMFIPALAVDAAGLRLGQGGGYYDRFLPKIDGYQTRIAALVRDDEFVEAGSFAVDRHDRPVGVVITPSAIRRLDNGF